MDWAYHNSMMSLEQLRQNVTRKGIKLPGIPSTWQAWSWVCLGFLAGEGSRSPLFSLLWESMIEWRSGALQGGLPSPNTPLFSMLLGIGDDRNQFPGKISFCAVLCQSFAPWWVSQSNFVPLSLRYLCGNFGCGVGWWDGRFDLTPMPLHSQWATRALFLVTQGDSKAISFAFWRRDVFLGSWQISTSPVGTQLS